MPNLFFNTFYKKQADGDIDLLADTIVALLLDGTTEPDIDNDEFISDISANEIAGGGYARKTLANKTTTIDNANDRVEFDADALDWSADTFTGAQFLAIAKNTGADGTSALICYFDFVTPKAAPIVSPSSDGYFAHGKA